MTYGTDTVAFIIYVLIRVSRAEEDSVMKHLLGAGDEAPVMEQKLVCDDRLDVACRLYRALCAQYPDRFITLFDATAHVSQLIAVGRKRPL